MQDNELITKLRNMNRLQFMNGIIEALKAKNYLEIGVEEGLVFSKIKIENKIGVDPIKPKEKVRNVLSENVKYFAMPSNDFFEKQKELLKNYPIDIAFVDGAHYYEQSLKDVLNCLKYLKDSGIIVIHDCNPTHEKIAKRAYSQKEAGRENMAWSGDVWKTIAYLRSQCDYLDVCVFDADYGLGVVKKGKPESMLNFSDEEIEKMKYQDLAKDRINLLNLKNPLHYVKFINELRKN